MVERLIGNIYKVVSRQWAFNKCIYYYYNKDSPGRSRTFKNSSYNILLSIYYLLLKAHLRSPHFHHLPYNHEPVLISSFLDNMLSSYILLNFINPLLK